VRSLVRIFFVINKMIKKIAFVFISFLIASLSIVILVNREEVYPSLPEQSALNNLLSNREIKSQSDIIFIQNTAISKIHHLTHNTEIVQLNTIKTIQDGLGLCYDRSLLLQKYFIMKGFKVRPVYLFWGNNSTSIFDLFRSNTQSHNVFEIYFNNNWYLIRTNNKMEKLEFLSQYLASGKIVPTHTRYVRYLNNRNGNFIYPSYIPDIYFF
jgi:hypothetical protein